MTSPNSEVSWQEALLIYFQPRVIAMAFLGFSAGIPYLLVFSTLTAWLTESGLSRTAIGFFAWIGITYSIKVFWAPIVDTIGIPLLTRRFGQRRSWMLLGQFGIAGGLVAMVLISPSNLLLFSLFALLVAFSSATQDISVDAYRIEAAKPEYQGAMSASYVFGYRVAILATSAGAFMLSASFGWELTYLAMAGLMIIGIVTVLVVEEPTKEGRPRYEFSSRGIHEWFNHAVIGPFQEFFKRNGRTALLMLLFIAVFRLSDIAMGVMANPFYLDMGYSKDQIGRISGLFGFFMTMTGSFICGVLVVKWGLMRPLLFGAVAVATTNLFFAGLSTLEAKEIYLVIVICADNISGGFAATAFIAYLSSLTNKAYTATQYALFSSLMTLPGKFISGFSGIVVDNFGYFEFFVVAACLGMPAILLVLYLARVTRSPQAAT